MKISTLQKIALGLIAILILIGIFYLVAPKNPVLAPAASSTKQTLLSVDSSSTPSGSVKPLSGASGSATLRSLVFSNQIKRCDISGLSSSGSISGTLYLSGNNLRGDLAINSKSSNFKTAILRTDGEVYLWTGNSGVKMPDSLFQTAKQSEGAAVNLDQNYTYKCSEWTIDPLKFAIPQGVTFMDIHS
ncbi:MAG TPA: hypothetical protein VFA52_01325 [Candidatus Paceibacterota bacterium]|nr:hypothetical protein [Candidatus Paceibacterota bacterium]